MSLNQPTSAAAFEVVAVVPPGLEAVAAAELERLGMVAVHPGRRAVIGQADLATFYRLHLRARIPFRLLRTLARFPCPSREALAAGVQRAVAWERWLPPEASLRVDTSGSTAALPHGHYTALTVKNALVDLQRQRWGARSSVDLEAPDLALHLHLLQHRNGGAEAVLSLDGGGGASLHRRGYRAAMGHAPLKENLAAGLIALTGWEGNSPLVDPMCGSGTLLIEAAAMALGLPAGLGPDGEPQAFGLRRWPDFDAELWQRELAACRAAAAGGGAVLPPLLGLERDPAVLAQARANAEAAGVAAHLQLELGDARELVVPEGPGLLVVNPPYGARLGANDDLEALYRALGQSLRQRCGGWTLWLLSGNPALSGALGMKASRRIPVSNGGIDCRWLRYEIRSPHPPSAGPDAPR